MNTTTTTTTDEELRMIHSKWPFFVFEVTVSKLPKAAVNEARNYIFHSKGQIAVVLLFCVSEIAPKEHPSKPLVPGSTSKSILSNESDRSDSSSLSSVPNTTPMLPAPWTGYMALISNCYKNQMVSGRRILTASNTPPILPSLFGSTARELSITLTHLILLVRCSLPYRKWRMLKYSQHHFN